MTAAAPISVDFVPATGLATYRWTQYQITTTVAGKSTTVAIAAMTRSEAVEYAKSVRETLSSLPGFDSSSMKLSHVHRTFVEEITAYDPGEDGDGSLHIAERLVSGERWERSSSRDFRQESYAAVDACAALTRFYNECS